MASIAWNSVVKISAWCNKKGRRVLRWPSLS